MAEAQHDELTKDLNSLPDVKINQLLAQGGMLFAACDDGEGELASLSVSVGIGPHDLFERNVRAHSDFYVEREIHPATNSVTVGDARAALLADLETLAEELEGVIEEGVPDFDDEQ
jgi:hypothetical protein